MDCNKTNIKRFKCLQGAAIKSKHCDRPLFKAPYDAFRTCYQLALLVCWSTLHSPYNWNEYHAVFQIPVHNNSPKWHIRLKSKVL